MGLIAKALAPLVRNLSSGPPHVPQWSGAIPQANYIQYARAYTNNEIVFSAIEMLATSASEPDIIGRKWQRESPMIRNEQRRLMAAGVGLRETNARMIENGFYKDLPNHPLIKLLNNPSPFMSRGQLWGTVVMDRALAGNAYLLKTRRQGGPLRGTVAELWRLRPDRVRIIPSVGSFIEGYEYNTGREKVVYPASDIIHFKTRNPLNDYYGMPPLMSIMGRISIDEYMQRFLSSFFERGGSGPGAILTSKAKIPQEQKDLIRDRYRTQFGGPQGAHELMVLDNTESTYQQMGLNRGLRDALPKEIDAVSEARIAMVFGIPGSILGLLIGYESSSYANKRQDWQVFWDLTMTPLLSDLDDQLNLAIVPDFGNIDEVMFDLSDIRALQEDTDKLRDRYRKDLLAGGISRERWQMLVGEEEDDGEILYVPSTVTPTKRDALGEMADAQLATELAPPPKQLPAPAAMAEVRHDCGKLIAKNVIGEPELYCERCKETFVPVA